MWTLPQHNVDMPRGVTNLRLWLQKMVAEMVARLSLLLFFLLGCLCTLAWSTTESVCDFSSSVRLGISWSEIANAKLYEIRYKKAGNRSFGVTPLFWFRSIRSLQHLTTSREIFCCCKIETASNYSLGHPYKKPLLGRGREHPRQLSQCSIGGKLLHRQRLGAAR